MTDNRPAGAIVVVGLGPSGRAVLDLLVPVSPTAHRHIAVARDRRALADCAADTKILLRDGNPSEDVTNLRSALEDAGLVIIAGSTNEGITPMILRVVKKQGLAVVRIVEIHTTGDPSHCLDHMFHEIIRENNAGMAGGSARMAPPPDVTPSG